MGLLDEVISAALGSKAPPAQGQSQSAPAQDQFSQLAAALQELLAPEDGWDAAAEAGRATVTCRTTKLIEWT